MLNNLTSLFKSKPQSKTYPMHLEGRGKEHRIVAKMALDVVRSGGVWSPNDLCEHLIGAYDKTVVDYIAVYLRSAWKSGTVSRAEVHQRGDQGRPSLVRYAADWRAL